MRAASGDDDVAVGARRRGEGEIEGRAAELRDDAVGPRGLIIRRGDRDFVGPDAAVLPIVDLLLVRSSVLFGVVWQVPDI